jgi:predicted nucleic acid-binding protein
MEGRLDLELEKGSLILLDTAPLVYLVEAGGGSERRAQAARGLFAALREEGFELCASALLWTELLSGPLARGDLSLAGRYRVLLADSRFVRLVPLDAAIAEEAARLAASPLIKGRLALADSIHLATAIVEGARGLLTNDEGLREAAQRLGAEKNGAPGGDRRRLALPEIFLFDELAYGVE